MSCKSRQGKALWRFNFNPQQIELLQQACSQRLLIDQLQFSIMHTGMIDFGLHTNMTDQASLNHDGDCWSTRGASK